MQVHLGSLSGQCDAALKEDRQTLLLLHKAVRNGRLLVEEGSCFLLRSKQPTRARSLYYRLRASCLGRRPEPLSTCGLQPEAESKHNKLGHPAVLH